MKRSIKIALSVLSVAAIAANGAALAGCGEKKEIITITGSTSVEEVMKVLAGKYEENHAVRINITGNGSSVGIKDSIEGRNDLGMASKSLSAEEKTQGIKESRLCIDGIVIVANKNCALENIDNDQAYNLYINGTSFTDNGTTISAAAGRDGASGTREAFDEKIVNPADGVSIKKSKTEYNSKIAQIDKTGGVISAIESDANNKTIGYISYGSYIKNTSSLKALNFKAYGEDTYVTASQTTIKSGDYKLQRPFMIITRTDGSMSEAAKAFYDWLFESEAQSILTESGYVL